MAIFWTDNNGRPAFYSEATHGARMIDSPQTEKERRAGKRAKQTPNPDTRIPADAKPISDETYAALIEAQNGTCELIVRDGWIVAVDALINVEAKAAARRARRDKALTESDWTQLPDSPLDSAARAAWASYRQALRDLDMSGDDFPAAPGAA